MTQTTATETKIDAIDVHDLQARIEAIYERNRYNFEKRSYNAAIPLARRIALHIRAGGQAPRNNNAGFLLHLILCGSAKRPAPVPAPIATDPALMAQYEALAAWLVGDMKAARPATPGPQTFLKIILREIDRGNHAMAGDLACVMVNLFEEGLKYPNLSTKLGARLYDAVADTLPAMNDKPARRPKPAAGAALGVLEVTRGGKDPAHYYEIMPLDILGRLHQEDPLRDSELIEKQSVAPILSTERQVAGFLKRHGCTEGGRLQAVGY
jgi:hypothetical protein